MDKVNGAAVEAVADIPDGATLSVRGFGLCGIGVDDADLGLPLGAGRGVVQRIIADLCVLDVTPEGLVPAALAPDVTFEQVCSATDAAVKDLVSGIDRPLSVVGASRLGALLCVRVRDPTIGVRGCLMWQVRRLSQGEAIPSDVTAVT